MESAAGRAKVAEVLGRVWSVCVAEPDAQAGPVSPPDMPAEPHTYVHTDEGTCTHTHAHRQRETRKQSYTHTHVHTLFLVFHYGTSCDTI